MRARVRIEPILLAALLLLAGCLRFFWLDGTSLWSDEGNTWALVQRSFAQIARDAAADIHPPGYYWILKFWTSIFGVSAAALRSFSAVAGTLLIFVIFRLGTYFSETGATRWTALLAALIAALNPFQIYYSQEARMYILLALEAAVLFWALFALLRTWRTASDRWLTMPGVTFVLAGAAGLWTHYSFPIVLAAAGLSFLVDWLWRAEAEERRSPRTLIHFSLLIAIIFLTFVPWLPTALTSILNWPQGGERISLAAGAALTARTLLFGPLRELPPVLRPWLVGAALLPIFGAFAWRRVRYMPLPVIWLLAPIGLMFTLGLFSDAFLKFLLVASAPWCLLVAAAGELTRPRWPLQLLLAGGTLAVAAISLPSYYGSTGARDNYAGVARYVAAAGDPSQDLVLLNAPGQQEVWSYYDPGLPVLALPTGRPADKAATEAALAAATADKRHAYALFWATDEADPARIVESWLDANAYKGWESWQGNLRFVTYTLPDDALTCTPLEPPVRFGEALALSGWCRGADGRIAAGDALPIALEWRAQGDIDARYKISVQLQDGTRQVVAQHDGEPAGGSRPTDAWREGEEVVDRRGLPIPPGTPPAPYRLVVAVYDAATGTRLATGVGDAAELGEIAVTLPTHPLPAAIVDVETRVDAPLGPATLLGYSQHKLGFAHDPTVPLLPGDLVEFVFFWQAPDPLPTSWPAAQTFTLTLGDQRLISPLAGPSLPTAGWQPGQLVRTTVQLPFDGTSRRATLTVEDAVLNLRRLPD